jgi:hypothetical protein
VVLRLSLDFRRWGDVPELILERTAELLGIPRQRLAASSTLLSSDPSPGSDELQILIGESADGGKSAEEAAIELSGYEPGYLSMVLRYPVDEVEVSELDTLRAMRGGSMGAMTALLIALAGALVMGAALRRVVAIVARRRRMRELGALEALFDAADERIASLRRQWAACFRRRSGGDGAEAHSSFELGQLPAVCEPEGTRTRASPSTARISTGSRGRRFQKLDEDG